MRRRDETVSRRRDSYHVLEEGQERSNGKGYSDSDLALIAAQIRLEKGIGDGDLRTVRASSQVAGKHMQTPDGPFGESSSVQGQGGREGGSSKDGKSDPGANGSIHQGAGSDAGSIGKPRAHQVDEDSDVAAAVDDLPNVRQEARPKVYTVVRQSLFGPSVTLYRVLRDETGAVLTYTVEKED